MEVVGQVDEMLLVLARRGEAESLQRVTVATAGPLQSYFQQGRKAGKEKYSSTREGEGESLTT
jgi:hypothetical protein